MSAPLRKINLSENVLLISGVSDIVRRFSFFFRSLESLQFGHQSSAHQGIGITGNSAINCWHALFT